MSIFWGPLYQKKLVQPYYESLIKEIDLYAEQLKNIEIKSIYIGGGSPTLMIDEIYLVINHIKNKFCFTGKVAIEASVSDINKQMIEKLKKGIINL